MQLFKIIEQKCQLCYACIRACPARAIKVENEHAKIINDRCIGCGSCLDVCGPNAIEYHSAVESVKKILQSGDKVAAIAAPSISGEFVDISDYRLFVGMLRELGFSYIHEGSFGVDLVAFEYQKLYKNFHGKYYITANCPVVPCYIEKYYPELMENLAPVTSPMEATAKVIRQIYGEEVKIVYIGPCIAAKDENLTKCEEGLIFDVLTFTELRQLFNIFNINENAVEYSEFDPPFGGKGALYPVRRGMLQAVHINEDLLSGEIIVTEGKTNFVNSIKEFRYSNEIHQHIDLYYCEGCIMGPGTSKDRKKFTRRTKVIDYTKKRLIDVDKEEWKKNILKFSNINLNRTYQSNDQRLPFPSEDQIQKVLNALNRGTKEKQLGCGACGYDSCRDFSIAICQGLAKFEMCHTFTINKMNRFIDKLNATNEKLSNTQTALKDSEHRARKEHQAAVEAGEAISAMMQKIRSGMVIVDSKLKIIESNNSFIKMLGEEAELINETIPGLTGADLKTLVPFHKLFGTVILTGEDLLNRDVYLGKDLLNISVFTIKKNEIVGGIIRDLYAPEVRKDEVIRRAKEVIKENLETVQQIAFLLGESASKTEKLLTSIIQTHNPEEK